MLWEMVESDIKCKAKSTKIYYDMYSKELYCSPALVVALVSSWDC